MPQPSKTEIAHDILRKHPHPLQTFFSPSNVAVVGATEVPKSVGRTVLWNLISNPFGGTVFPVNPKRSTVLGIKAYPSIAEVPAQVDLAVIVTPASTAPMVVRECAQAGVPTAIVISAGFKEMGTRGAELEREVLAEARRGRMRIIGPNCLGLMSPIHGLNATFAGAMARPGNLAFLSQSGALLTAILDWSLREQVGFSGFVSMGSMIDVGFGDLIDYFAGDSKTQGIMIYMESIGDARSFLSAAREVALTKPIIVIKAGQSEQAARAAASHTGALTGSDEVLEAAFRRTGVLRVPTIDDLFSMAEVLAKQPRPLGPRLTIVTNAGGPAVLATDALVSMGGELASLSDQTISALDAVLPEAWSRGNPIDVLGDAGTERYAKAIAVATKDPSSDGLLVVLTPQDMTDATATAQAVVQLGRQPKPVLASFMGGPTLEPAKDILNRANIPTFEFPDSAARAFCYMWRYTYNLRGLYETPIAAEVASTNPSAVSEILTEARRTGRTLLDEHESKQVMFAYGIPIAATRIASTEDEAVAAAEAIGFPVVVKLFSKTITHKTDVGGVALDLRDGAAVRRAFRDVQKSVTRYAGAEHFAGVTVQPMVQLRDAYELIIGSSLDPQFGPVLLFGSGGQLVEVYRDRALALPPLNATLARRMMEQTRIYQALRGIRGRNPVDLPALEQLLVRFSQLVLDHPRIREVDINPLLASSDTIMALDARVVLHPATVADDDLPRPAIRPYPTQYVGQWTTKKGTGVTIRPIRPEDEPLMVAFHRTLREETIRLRYFQALQLDQRTAHERLIRVCFNDYDRELALVTEFTDPTSGKPEILAVGRLSKIPWYLEAEFAVLVGDAWQGQGVGSELLARLIAIGRSEKLERITGTIMRENVRMRRVCERLGFQVIPDPEEPILTAMLSL